MSVFGRNPIMQKGMHRNRCFLFKGIIFVTVFVNLVTFFSLSNRKLTSIGSPCTLESKDRVTIDAHYNCDTSGDSAKPKLTVDIVSIGSQSRPALMRMQQNTWATHKSVRSFWGLSELDDGVVDCTSEQNETEIKEYLEYCKTEKPTDNNLTKKFARWNYKQRQEDKPIGWLCAQRRPGYALGKRSEAYRSDVLKYGADAALPDYLILMDDDTYFNMERFNGHMENKNASIPMAYSGCMFTFPVLNYPWGGFGLILSRGSLELMIRPLHCDKRNDDESEWGQYESSACSRMEENHLGEKYLFQPGMSISDLAYAISSKKYFCMHSDWLTGYLVNYYHLSEPVSNETYRLHNILGKRDCIDEQYFRCGSTSLICHGLDGSAMIDISVDVIMEYPAKYRIGAHELFTLTV